MGDPDENDSNVTVAVAVLFVGSGLPLHMAQAQEPGVKRTDLPRHQAAGLIAPAAGGIGGTPLPETGTIAADEPIPNVAGKRLVTHIVDYPPGTSSAPHRHARSAFIYAYVLSARSGARSMASLPASIGPVRRGSKAPAPIIG
jgi:hypothetical protein